MTNKILKIAGAGLLIALFMFLLVNRGAFDGLQKGIQNKFYDFASASPEIVIVAIDEKSLSSDQLGPLPRWERANYGKAIEILNEEGAAVIGIDMTFPDQSIHGPADDEAFQKNLSDSDNVVLAARYYFENGGRIPELPNRTLLKAEPKVGWINVSLDEDGFVRKLPIFSSAKEQMLEAFSLEIARQYMNQEPLNHTVSHNQYEFSEEMSIPVHSLTDSVSKQETHFMYINYFGAPGSFTQVSMADLLSENFVDNKGNRASFNEKIVLIGPTAIDLQDYYNSPVSQGVRMPGVEIHANNIQTIISEKYLRDQTDLSLWLGLAGLILVNLILFTILRIRYAIPILIIELFGVMVAGIVAYEQRIFLNVIYPFITILITFISSFLLRLRFEQGEKKYIKGAFGHFVNKSVVDQILKDPKMLELGGAKREVTAFFSDVAGFTSIAEGMEPGQLVTFLNSYLDEMTNVILEHKGTLDKYEGDAIMAFWGAPVPQKDHALHACLAALENQGKVAQFRLESEKNNLPPIHIRIGINTGEVIAGNMGSEDRFDYTIMGDNVNLASRLESINKQYGTEVMISEYTYETVKEALVCRELDQIRVKGKDTPVRIYELIGKKDEVPQERLAIIQAFDEALKLYRSKNFMAAQKKFSVIANDPPSKVFVERCNAFIKNPPDVDWDGVYTFTTK